MNLKKHVLFITLISMTLNSTAFAKSGPADGGSKDDPSFLELIRDIKDSAVANAETLYNDNLKPHVDAATEAAAPYTKYVDSNSKTPDMPFLNNLKKRYREGKPSYLQPTAQSLKTAVGAGGSVVVIKLTKTLASRRAGKVERELISSLQTRLNDIAEMERAMLEAGQSLPDEAFRPADSGEAVESIDAAARKKMAVYKGSEISLGDLEATHRLSVDALDKDLSTAIKKSTLLGRIFLGTRPKIVNTAVSADDLTREVSYMSSRILSTARKARIVTATQGRKLRRVSVLVGAVTLIDRQLGIWLVNDGLDPTLLPIARAGFFSYEETDNTVKGAIEDTKATFKDVSEEVKKESEKVKDVKGVK